MTTLREVAAKAGVSVRTVSNVVNHQPCVAEDTRARVQVALDELGYRQNVVARSLRTGRIGLLGLVVPDIAQSHFAQLGSAVINEATRLGYTLAIDQTESDPDREKRLVQIGPHGAMFDGAIFHPQTLSAQEFLHRQNTFPLVLVGERLNVGTMDRVYTDDRQAADDATSHLIDDGARVIAAIGLRSEGYANTARLREEGCREALARHGRTPTEHYMRYVAEYDAVNGYAAMGSLLQLPERPDAVFCFSDTLAIGALRRMHDEGVRIPQDIALLGFDDISESEFTYPALSTVSADTPSIAREAVSALLNRITHPDAPVVERTVGHRVVLRQTTWNRRTTRPRA